MSRSSPGSGRAPVVLATDPDPGVRAFLAFVFRLWGVRLVLAADGREVAEILRRYGDELTVALVGEDALDVVREAAPGLPCWVMTPDPSSAPEWLGRGAAGVVGKPFVPSALRSVVARASVAAC